MKFPPFREREREREKMKSLTKKIELNSLGFTEAKVKEIQQRNSVFIEIQ